MFRKLYLTLGRPFSRKLFASENCAEPQGRLCLQPNFKTTVVFHFNAPSWPLVLCPWSVVLGPRLLALGPLGLGPWFLGLGPWFLILDPGDLASWFLVLCPSFLVLGPCGSQSLYPPANTLLETRLHEFIKFDGRLAVVAIIIC